MKKMITLIALLAHVMMASATDYTDRLSVKVADVMADPQQATISIEPQQDGTRVLLLKNFSLMLGGEPMDVGTIELKGVKSVDADGVTTMYYNDQVDIKPGDDASRNWLASTGALTGVPVRLMAEVRGEKLYAVININFGMDIRVTFGDGGYQIPNGDFETFHKENDGDVDEADHWHSFGSAYGKFASMASGQPHTFISDVVRPGSTGKHSVLLKSTSMFFGLIIANGTMTTGRMKAGATNASDPENHAEIDMSSTDKDANGDPFYVALNAVPQSLKVWVKFKQGTPQPKAPYATVSAAVTDGTYYQEPAAEGVVYNNVAARAQNATIETQGGEWQELTIPFEQVNAGVTPKALFVTVSTNALPGKGSGTDELYVDDMELVYDHDAVASSLTIGGKEIASPQDVQDLTLADGTQLSEADVKVNTQMPRVIKQVEKSADGVKVTVVVASADLAAFKTYVVNVKGATTGISGVRQVTAQTEEAIYNLQGQRVSEMTRGHIYIVKKDGKTVKVQR